MCSGVFRGGALGPGPLVKKVLAIRKKGKHGLPLFYVSTIVARENLAPIHEILNTPLIGYMASMQLPMQWHQSEPASKFNHTLITPWQAHGGYKIKIL